MLRITRGWRVRPLELPGPAVTPARALWLDYAYFRRHHDHWTALYLALLVATWQAR